MVFYTFPLSHEIQPATFFLTAPRFCLPAPFIGTHQVVADEIDAYDHVNNTVYLQWLDRIAWEHSAELGLPIDRCLEIRCGMAVRHTRVDYLEAAVLGDSLILATWIIACDGRLRCSRRFEIQRGTDGKHLLDAEIDFFCLNLATGKPCRFPPEFTACYKPMPEVVAAYAKLAEGRRRLGRWRGPRSP
jgi:acyl-CoA thioester hydrolase